MTEVWTVMTMLDGSVCGIVGIFSCWDKAWLAAKDEKKAIEQVATLPQHTWRVVETPRGTIYSNGSWDVVVRFWKLDEIENKNF